MTSSILESIKRNNEERVQYIMEHPIENLMKTAMTNLKRDGRCKYDCWESGFNS